MTCWDKKQLEQMLEDVVNELDLSDSAIAEHGPMGTPPAELVRLVLDRKDKVIKMLRAGMVDASQPTSGADRADADVSDPGSIPGDEELFNNGAGW